MDLNPGNYNLNEITVFFNLEPNHTFTQVNDAFRKKHNEISLSNGISKEQKDEMLFFLVQLKNKLVLHLSKQNVSHNNFNNSLVPNNNTNDKIDDHVDTVTNNKIMYQAGVSKEVSAGRINPIERNILNNVIHFDTRFKQNYTVSDSKFTFKFPTSFKNCISMKLLSFEIPQTIYNFTTNLGNRTFVIHADNTASVSAARNVDTTITIDEGKYTKTTLLSEIQSKLVTNVDANFTVAENDADTSLLRIRNSNSVEFTLKFPGIKDRVNLGFILGFADETKVAATSGTNRDAIGTKIPDFNFNNYFYLSLDDYQMSVNQNHYAVMNKNFVTKNIFAKLKNKTDESNTDYFIKKKYFGPVTLERVTFELLDRYGNALDLKGLDYSFSVELELLYKY